MLNDELKSVEAVQVRLRERVTRALRGSCDETKPPLIRGICTAYLDVHRNLPLYLKSAMAHPCAQDWIESGESYKDVGFQTAFSMGQFIVAVPALWEFGFTIVVGDVNDACWCAIQYGRSNKWSEFIGVRPMESHFAFPKMRIPIHHKENSRFRQGYEGRLALKKELGGKFRSLVQFARQHTKKEFLENFRNGPLEFISTASSIKQKDNDYENKRNQRNRTSDLR